jgi:hypothetical protein
VVQVFHPEARDAELVQRYQRFSALYQALKDSFPG